MSCTTYHVGQENSKAARMTLPSFRPIQPGFKGKQSRKKLKKIVEKYRENLPPTETEFEEDQSEELDILYEMIRKDFETKRFFEIRGFCCHCGKKFGGEYDVYLHANKTVCSIWNCVKYKFTLGRTKVKIWAAFLYDSFCHGCEKEFDGWAELEKHKAKTECGQKFPELIMNRQLHLVIFVKKDTYFSYYKLRFMKTFRL
ncbi:uncharacterized protein LOC111627449 [Centruroides sculpturatus]|uniref:uncharacterized protein LOC111627449 n=1 Tax=Centruroides sculpturatus TaxID=218467 RepID=UPI000C6DCE4E|nr:uncharacterized protein LOC111627449 [Centruroides sculpturatus]XP_023226785.1 uncharacterized protein LOC111627449 [Centruroides sculpturatus]XP_023226786.1 uncharacterized protein LOC111627449 [Centruroides sculpturatus]XP_023226787.1 uncharacterized protein LOC111627449 [Centruroides sculpturatus]